MLVHAVTIHFILLSFTMKGKGKGKRDKKQIEEADLTNKETATAPVG